MKILLALIYSLLFVVAVLSSLCISSSKAAIGIFCLTFVLLLYLTDIFFVKRKYGSRKKMIAERKMRKRKNSLESYMVSKILCHFGGLQLPQDAYTQVSARPDGIEFSYEDANLFVPLDEILDVYVNKHKEEEIYGWGVSGRATEGGFVSGDVYPKKITHKYRYLVFKLSEKRFAVFDVSLIPRNGKLFVRWFKRMKKEQKNSDA